MAAKIYDANLKEINMLKFCPLPYWLIYVPDLGTKAGEGA